MKMLKLMAVAIAIGTLALNYNSRAQELTKEQVYADEQRQAQMEESAAIVFLKNVIENDSEYVGKLSPEQLERKLALAEELQKLMPPQPISPTKGAKKNTSLAGLKAGTSLYSVSSGAGGAMMMRTPSQPLQSGNDYIENLAASLNIGENDIYGVGPITNGGDWNLYPNVQHYHHQWFAVPRTLEPTNGLMLQTQYGSSYGAYPDWNQFGCKMPKTWLVFPYSTNGLAVSNRQQYVLRFKYNWTGTNASVFNLSSNVHSMVGSIAPFEHVTERSTNWTQFTCVIPTNVTTSWIYWTLGVDVQGAPRAQVDAVQFIPIPKPTEDDFALVQDGDNMIVQWNTLPFAYFHLEYASDLKGPWATNTVTPSVTNYVASVTFTNTGGNGKRFYRMHHNLHQN